MRLYLSQEQSLRVLNFYIKLRKRVDYNPLKVLPVLCSAEQTLCRPLSPWKSVSTRPGLPLGCLGTSTLESITALLQPTWRGYWENPFFCSQRRQNGVKIGVGGG